MHHKKWESVETRCAQTTTLSYPFSVTHKLHRLERGEVKVKSKVKNNDLQLLLEKCMSVEAGCFGVAVAFDFDVDLHPLLTLPIVQDRKWIRKLRCLSAASFEAFPFFVLHNWAPEGQWQRGRLSLLPFFGEAKKVTGCRATPDL